MATTTKKTAAARKAPQDRKPPQSAAQRLEAEALQQYQGGPFTVTINGQEYPVLDPEDWPATAQEALVVGAWIAFVTDCTPEESQRDWSLLLGRTTTRELKRTRALLIAHAQISAQNMGEGEGSLSS